MAITSTTPAVSDELLKREFIKAKESTKMISSFKPFNKGEKVNEEKVNNKIEEWKGLGIEAIKSGQIAVVTMAGGQGTRLGTSSPKGMFKVSLSDGSSITSFQIQKDRLEELAKKTNSKIHWLIMTSSATHKETVDYFSQERNKYVGGKLSFFQQDNIPALDQDGKPIKVDPKGNMFMAPNGNGNLFEALKKSGELNKLKAEGIKWIHVITIDNFLINVADPIMLGAAIKNLSDIVMKSVKRKGPNEKIGVFALNQDEKIIIAEYSELPKNSGSEFTEANMASHLFSMELVETAANLSLPYHLAEKKIPMADGTSIMGYKLEKFIFDVLPYAKKPLVLNVDRSSEFSPLKNATGEDSPMTCASDLEKSRLLNKRG